MAEGMEGGIGASLSRSTRIHNAPRALIPPYCTPAIQLFQVRGHSGGSCRERVPYATHNDVIFQMVGVSLLLDVFIVPAEVELEERVYTQHANISLGSSLILWSVSFVSTVVSRNPLITRYRTFSSPFSKLKVSFLGKFEGRARVSWLVRSNDNLFPEIKTRADSSRSSFLLVLVVECTVVLRQHVKLRPFIMHPRYHLSVHMYVRFKIWSKLVELLRGIVAISTWRGKNRDGETVVFWIIRERGECFI